MISTLENMSPEIRVPAEIAQRARRSIDRMLELA
jgi:quinolinate synthase